MSITFTKTETSVAGHFPAGLVRGVKAFDFTVSATATPGELTTLNMQHMTINGVECYAHVWAPVFTPYTGNEWSFRAYGFEFSVRRYEYADVSAAAKRAVAEVIGLIISALRGSDVVASAVMDARRKTLEDKMARARREIADHLHDIGLLETEVAEFEAEAAALAGVDVTASELTLLQTLTGNGVAPAEAVAATKAALGTGIIQACSTCGGDATGSKHLDESPARIYCDKCAGCDELATDDRCDSCFQAAELVEAAQ